MSSSPVSKLEESEQIVELNAQLGQAKQVNAQLERLQEHLKMLIQNIQVLGDNSQQAQELLRLWIGLCGQSVKTLHLLTSTAWEGKSMDQLLKLQALEQAPVLPAAVEKVSDKKSRKSSTAITSSSSATAKSGMEMSQSNKLKRKSEPITTTTATSARQSTRRSTTISNNTTTNTASNNTISKLPRYRRG